MGAELDSLQVRITASSKQATDAIDRLVSSLEHISGALMPASSGMDRFADSLDRIVSYSESLANTAKSLKDLSRVSSALNTFSDNGNPFTGVLTGLRELETVNIPGTLSNLSYIKESISKIGGDAGTNAAASLTQIANGLKSFEGVTIPVFGENLTNLATGLRALGSGNIVAASQSLPYLSEGLRELANVHIGTDVEAIANLAHAVSRFGLANIEKAIVNIPPLANALRDLITTLSNAPVVSDNTIRMINSLSNLQVRGTQSSKAIDGLSLSLKKYSGAANKAKKASLSLAGVAGSIYANFFLVFRLFQQFGNAIKQAADLVEVQNVVDVTFGNMANKMNEFSQSAIDALGMSELTAKTIGSRFQAMGAAMNISDSMIKGTNDFVQATTHGYAEVADSIADVSINLTKLAGDMASFYNKDYEEVAKDLEAAYTGMTRPLRKYGLDLTQATLKEFALANGLNADIKSMTQAEKTLLRYQYIMANTTAAHGDFERTINSFSNQVRLAKQYLNQFMIILGKIGMYTFKPLVQSFNQAMKRIIELATATLNSLGKIFGWQIEWSDAGVLRDEEDAAGEIADDMGDAADNAKKFKNFLLGIDELNLLPDNSDKDKDKGGLGGIGAGLGDLEGGLKIKPIEKGFESLYDTLYKLGKRIAEVIKDWLKNIDWDAIYKKARRFGRDLAEFLNGYLSDAEMFYEKGRFIANGINAIAHAIDSFFHEFNGWQLGVDIGSEINGITENLDWNVIKSAAYEMAHDIAQAINGAFFTINWSMVGKTIAEGLNTAFLFLYTIGDEINWKLVGKSLSDAVNAFFATFDFGLAGSTINAWATGILDGIYTALDNINWNLVGKKIGEFIKKLNVAKIAAGLSKVLVKAFQAAVDVLASSFGEAPLETAMLGAIALIKPSGIGSALTKLFTSGIGLLDKNAISGALTGLLSKLGISGSSLFGAGAGLAEFFVIKDTFKDLYDGAENFSNALIKIGTSAVAAGGVMTAIFGFPAGTVAAAVIALGAEIVGISQSMIEAYQEAEKLDFASILGNGGIGIGDYFKNASDDMRNTYDDYNNLARKIEETDFSGLKKNIDRDMKEIGLSIDILGDSLSQNAESVEKNLEKIEGLFENFKDDVSKLFSEEIGVIEEAAMNGMVDNAAELTAAANDVEYATIEAIQNIYDRIAENQALFDEGKIPYNEYKGQLTNLWNELNAIYAETTNEGLDKIAETASKIDFSKFLLGEENIDSVQASMEEFSVIYSNALNDIGTSFDGLYDTYRDIGERAKSVGDEENSTKFANAIIDGQAKEIELVEKANQEYISKMEELENQAWEQLGVILSNPNHLAPTDVADRAQKYITDILTPLENAITEETAKVGITWSSGISDMSQQLYDALGTSLSGMGVDGKNYGTDLFSLWDEKFSKAAENGQRSIKAITSEQSDAQRKALDFAEAQGLVTKELELSELRARANSKGLKDTKESLKDVSSAAKGGKNDLVPIQRAMSDIGSASAIAKSNLVDFSNAFGRIGDSGKNVEQVATGFKSIDTIIRQFTSQFPIVQSGFGTVTTTMQTNVLGIDNAFRKMYTDIMADGQKTLAWFRGSFATYFSAGYWNSLLSGIPIAFHNAFTLAFNNVKQMWTQFAQWANQNMKMDISAQKNGKGGSEVKMQFPMYEKGGFPEDGMFFANHTEMVGQFSNGRTAVANNEQIVEGIRQGVYDAVVSAMAVAGGGGSNVTVELSGDASDIFTAVVKENNRSIMRTGASPIRV